MPVFAAVRNAARFHDLADEGLRVVEMIPGCSEISALPKQAIIVDLIPPLSEQENAGLRLLVKKLQPARLVYISSTGVYGGQIEVDENTRPEANDARGLRRLDDEKWVTSGPWTSLVLRAAAIYGPGRGVHAAVREGRTPRGMSSGVVSRIHVEDLARIIEAGIFSDLDGAWPVADNDPCSSAEIVRWCTRLFQIKEISPRARETVLPGRRVDGRKVREKLGIELTYSSWRTGVPASLAEENR
jgi:nucleoside-diphosphate-sugar epimerase